MAKGSCLCGKVQFEADEIGPSITKCHCKICQKVSGSAYADFTTAPVGKFRWTAGEQTLARYESSPNTFRHFCATCGTHMPSAHETMGIVFIPPGVLDTEEPLRETAHMFLRSKAPWHQLSTGLAEFAEYPA